MAQSVRRLFDEDHQAFRDTVQRFLADHVVPHLDEWRIAGEVPRELFLAAGADGLLGTAVPEDLGGGGTDDPRFTAVLVEETARIGATGLALLFAMHSGVCLPLLLQHGTAEQRQQWVPLMASGETVAVLVGGGRPVDAVLNGAELAVDSTVDGVAGGLSAGLLITAVHVAGRTRLVLLPADSEVVVAAPVGTSLAAREVGQADLTLRGALPGKLTLPTEGAPDEDAARDLDLWSALLAVAAARSVLEMTLDYVRERSVFGRPLAEFENTRHTLAKVSADISSAQLVVDAALEQRMAGTLTGEDAAIARLGALTSHDRSVDEGMQLHGGYGYMREYPISHAFADARYLRNQASAGTAALEVLATSLGI